MVFLNCALALYCPPHHCLHCHTVFCLHYFCNLFYVVSCCAILGCGISCSVRLSHVMLMLHCVFVVLCQDMLCMSFLCYVRLCQVVYIMLVCVLLSYIILSQVVIRCVMLCWHSSLPVNQSHIVVLKFYYYYYSLKILTVSSPSIFETLTPN